MFVKLLRISLLVVELYSVDTLSLHLTFSAGQHFVDICSIIPMFKPVCVTNPNTMCVIFMTIWSNRSDVIHLFTVVLVPLTCSVVHYFMMTSSNGHQHFPRYWPFVRGIHRSPVNSPHKGQWRRALIFYLICAWTNGSVSNRDAGDLRRHRAHYDVILMSYSFVRPPPLCICIVSLPQ